MSMRLAGLALAALLFAFPAHAADWTYTDGSGKTVTLDHVPTRIVAHANSAAALIAFGIRPVGIYVDSPVADDPSLRGVDISGIEIVGEAWGEINVEKVAALKPDLIVAEFWPLERAYSGLEKGENSPANALMALAPVAGPAQGDSILTLIQDYEKLAQSLGADVEADAVKTDRAAFETALDGFKAAVAGKPGLTVLATSPSADNLYIASVAGASELSDFARWGMDIITPAHADDRGYWETLSWENADKYQPDLVIVDDRFNGLGVAADKPTWQAIKAVQAGAVAKWPAFWMRSYAAYARELALLTAAVDAADPNLAP